MKKYWTDLHSNIHHHQMAELPEWVEWAKETLDFWPIAYYPFSMHEAPGGAKLEGLCDEKDIQQDWQVIKETVARENENGFPMFAGYEWQGAGLDGDHNVFFLHNNEPMIHPMRYEQLRTFFQNTEAIAIPHHVAYQLGSRGKNWETHNEAFSPFAEIFSSHGCSENDTCGMDMTAHLHMGPRTGETCYEHGLNKGWKVGCIASGDNHVNPAVYENGMMCVLAEDDRKESLWEGLRASRVYGVSRSRMDIDYEIDGVQMGGTIEPGEHMLQVNITAADAIDRVEVLKDNILQNMIVHSGTWERTPIHEKDMLRVKFAVEFGWGPNPNHYKGKETRQWKGSLTVDGRLISIEKQYNRCGQKLFNVTENSCCFDMTTYMPAHGSNWMRSARVETEGFVFEVEGNPDSMVTLTIDGKEHQYTVRELMQTSRIIADVETSERMARENYNYQGYYRDDFIWHNAYKCRIRQAVPENAYTLQASLPVRMEAGSQCRLRVHLKNGDRAWVSPIFCREK